LKFNIFQIRYSLAVVASRGRLYTARLKNLDVFRKANGPDSRPEYTDEGVCGVTIDKSLKVKSGVSRSRNVLTRAERIEKLSESDRWQEGDPVIGLPKVRVVKISLKKKKKVKKADDEGDDKKKKK